MNKTILTFAAAAVLGTAAFNANAMGEKPVANSAAMAAASAPAATTSAELEHRMATLQTGMLAMETSRLALSRATNPLVKQFAQAEVTEQTTIAEIFKSVYPNAPEVTLNAENTQKLAALKNAPSSQFDKMYVMNQLEGHKMLLEIQDDYISDAKNREEMNVAKLARVQIKEHIMLLQAFQQHAK